MTMFKFLLVGIVNTFMGLGTIYVAMYFLQLGVIYSNILGYVVGIFLGFFLNKTWTFSHNGNMTSTFLSYLLVIIIAYLANLYTVFFAKNNIDLSIYIIQALGIIPYTIISYLGSRYFVFDKQLPPQKTTNLTYENPIFSDKLILRMIETGIVIPCYNEEATLPETTRQLAELLSQLINEKKITPNSRIYYIDDGSQDNTWQLIESLAKNYQFIHGIKLSCNRGHQNALLAGLLSAEGEIIISVDADLQDDLSAITKMIEFYAAGYHIVYGVRDSRKTDTLFKRFTAQAYYRLLSLMGVEIIYNHADYRLMSRRVIEALREFDEVNLFLRGIIPQLGFSSTSVYYDRAERYAGESKYPLKKMLSFAWQGITSFSDFPLRLITGLGLLVSLISFLFSAWAIAVRLFTQSAIPGWASTVLPIYFLGGIQLLCLGIIGEYLAKIYAETKRRPRYIIEKSI